jgi:hypothetical protein
MACDRRSSGVPATADGRSVNARFVTLAGFAVLGAFGICWSAVSARRSLVTLPQLLGRVAASRPVRLLFVVAWAWLGWHLFARGSGAFE